MLQIIDYQPFNNNNNNMTNQEQFVHFLDGYLIDKTELNAAQTQLLKDKLGAVFVKVTPKLTYNNFYDKVDKPTIC